LTHSVVADKALACLPPASTRRKAPGPLPQP
jgi:hypothetical protein